MPSDFSQEPKPPDEEPSSDEEEAAPEEPIPDSDVVGPAEWATALPEADEAAMIFQGDNVGQGRINAGLAASLLQFITGFVKPLTGVSPDFTGVSASASTAFHFAPGYGEQSSITETGDVTTPIRDAFEKLVSLIELTSDDQALLEEARNIPAHAAANYVHLLRTVSENSLTTTVLIRFRETGIRLAPRGGASAKAVLERQAPERFEHREVIGYLYEANAKKHGFELEEEGVERRFEGTYLPELEDKIGEAWNTIARVALRLKWTRLERRHAETLESVTLLDVLEIVSREPPASLL